MNRKNNVYPVIMKDNDSIPISKYQDWFEAIIIDDVEKAKSILSNVSENEQNLLLNFPFDFEDSDTIDLYYSYINNRILLPFHLAITFCSRNIAKLFLSKSVEVTKIDEHSRNALHSCVAIAFAVPYMEHALCDMLSWLEGEIEFKDLRTLQCEENDDGLRPIEYASQQGCLLLLKTMLETKGYVSNERSCGLALFRTHGVTEYELGSRHGKSPLHMISSLDREKLKCPETSKILLSPLIKGWIDRKIHSNILPVVIIVIFRLLFVAAYMNLDADVGWIKNVSNQSDNALCPDLSLISLNSTSKQQITLVIFSYGSFLMLMDIIDVIRYYKQKFYLKKHNISGAKQRICNTTFFKVNNILLTLVILFCTVNFMVIGIRNERFTGNYNIVLKLARGLIPVLSMWSVAYILQLVPYIGFSIITIQGMTLDMARFMVLFILVLLPFVHVFESYVQVNADNGCVPEFSSPQMTIYTLFRMMLSMYDVTTLDVADIGVIYVFHTMFIFVVAVLLLNFLIAIMSSSASTIAENEKVILLVNQLALVVSLEENYFWISKWLYKIFRNMSFHCKDGKVYITSVGRKKELLQNKNFEHP